MMVGTERQAFMAGRCPVKSDFASEISHTRSLVNRYLSAELARRGYAGLSPSHGDILAQLCRSDRMRMSELSRRIDRDPSTVTALVRKLIALGFAETARDETDRRATVVKLTERGRALEKDFGEISALLHATWQIGIAEEDLEVAARVLAAMRANLRAAIEGEPLQGEEGAAAPPGSCAPASGAQGPARPGADWARRAAAPARV